MDIKDLINPKVFKEIFYVEGQFYTIQDRISKYGYRSSLTISRYKKAEEKNLLVIMLNPGSSKAMDTLPESYGNFDKGNQPQSTHPDATQYQIMRLMYKLSFSKADIINLFDIIEPKSGELFKQLKEGTIRINEGAIQDPISIFHESRKVELEKYFICNRTIVIAWGILHLLKVSKKTY